MLDVAIIGGGPAALSAAIYCGRAGLKTEVFEKNSFGGELSRISNISNYPGFTGRGSTLAQHFRKQAEEAGVKISYGECQEITPPVYDEKHSSAQLASLDSTFTIQIDGEPVSARTVLIATGSQPRSLGFEITPPVSYCALCDSDFARDKHVAVIGGANSAVQEALYLAPIVKDLDLITHSTLKADQVLRSKLSNHPNITVRENIEPVRELLDQYDYVFVFIGSHPATSFLRSLDPSICDQKGYLLTGEQARPLDPNRNKSFVFRISFEDYNPTPHATSLPGLFAAGDVRAGCPKQVVCAAGDGAAAAIEIIHLLQN